MDAKQQLKGLWKRSTEQQSSHRNRPPKKSPRLTYQDYASGTLSPSSSEFSLQTIDDNNDPDTRIRAVRFRFYESFSLITIENKFDPRDIKLITNSDYLIQRILNEEGGDVDRTVQWLGHLLTWRKQTGIRELSLDEFDKKLLNIHPLEFVHGGNLDILVCSMARLIKVTDLVGVVRANRLLICHFEKLFSNGAGRNLTLVVLFGRVSADCWSKLSNRHLLNELICGCAYFRYPCFVEKVIFLDWPMGAQGKGEFNETIARDWPTGVKARIVFADHGDIIKAAPVDQPDKPDRISPDDLCIQSVLYLLSEPSISTSMDSCGGDSDQINVNLKMKLSPGGLSQQTLRSSSINSTSEFSSRLTTSVKDTTSNGTAAVVQTSVPVSRPPSGSSFKKLNLPTKNDTPPKPTSGKTPVRPSSVKSAETSRIPEFQNNRTYILQPCPRSGPRSDPGPPAKRQAAPKKLDSVKAPVECFQRNVQIVFEPTPPTAQVASTASPKTTTESKIPRPRPRLKCSPGSMSLLKGPDPRKTDDKVSGEKSPKKPQAPSQMTGISNISGDSAGLQCDKPGVEPLNSVRRTATEAAFAPAVKLQDSVVRTRPNQPLDSPRRMVNVPEILKPLESPKTKKPPAPEMVTAQLKSSTRSSNAITDVASHALRTPGSPQSVKETNLSNNQLYRDRKITPDDKKHPADLVVSGAQNQEQPAELLDIVTYRDSLNANISYVLSQNGTTHTGNLNDGSDHLFPRESSAQSTSMMNETPGYGSPRTSSARLNQPVLNMTAKYQSKPGSPLSVKSEFADLKTLQAELDGSSDHHAAVPVTVLKLDRSYTSLRNDPSPVRNVSGAVPVVDALKEGQLPMAQTEPDFHRMPAPKLAEATESDFSADTLLKVDANNDYNSRISQVAQARSVDFFAETSVKPLPSIVSSGQVRREILENLGSPDAIGPSSFAQSGDQSNSQKLNRLSAAHEPYQSEYFSKFIRQPDDTSLNQEKQDAQFVDQLSSGQPGIQIDDGAVKRQAPVEVNSEETHHPPERYNTTVEDMPRPPIVYEYQLHPRVLTSHYAGQLPPMREFHHSPRPFHQPPLAAKNPRPQSTSQFLSEEPQFDAPSTILPGSDRIYTPRTATYSRHAESIAMPVYFTKESTRRYDEHVIRRVESRELEYREEPSVKRSYVSDRRLNHGAVEQVHGGQSMRRRAAFAGERYNLQEATSNLQVQHAVKDLRDATTSTPRSRVIKPTVRVLPKTHDPETTVSVSELPVVPEDRATLRIAKTVTRSFSEAVLPIVRSVSAHSGSCATAAERTLGKSFFWTTRLGKLEFKLWLWQLRLFLSISCSLILSWIWRHKWKTGVPLLLLIMTGVNHVVPVLMSRMPLKPWKTEESAVKSDEPVPFSPRELFAYWAMGGKVRKQIKEPPERLSEPPASPTVSTVPADSKPPASNWPTGFGPSAPHEGPGCTENEDIGPREILAGWTMGNILRLGSKKLCADAQKIITENIPAVQPERATSISNQCSAFDASCLWRSITTRFNPLKKLL